MEMEAVDQSEMGSSLMTVVACGVNVNETSSPRLNERVRVSTSPSARSSSFASMLWVISQVPGSTFQPGYRFSEYLLF
jgi:hypothetical protein